MPGKVEVSREALYRAMIEQALDALLVLDDDRFIDCNLSAETMFGLPRDQLLDSSPVILSARNQPDGRDSLSAANNYIALAKTGVPQRFEWLSRKPDGELFTTEVCLSLLDEAGHQYVIAVVRDISKRRKAEQEGRRQNEKLRVLLENFPGGVSLIDESLRMVTWNAELLRMLDLPPELFDGKQPLARDVYQANIKRGEYGEFSQGDDADKLNRLMSIIQGKDAYTYERVRSDGSVIEVRGVPVEGGGFVTTCIDVTARRKIEIEFHKQSLFLKAVLDHMPQGLSVFDDRLKLYLWNQGFLDVLDYHPDSIYQGVPFEDLLRIMAERGEYGEGDTDELIQRRLQLAQQFQPHQFERVRPNAHTHLVQGKPIHEDGKLKGFVTTYTDITELKKVEQALSDANALLEKNVAERTLELRHTQDDLIRSEKLAALGSLVAGVAHELNTPIGNSLLTANTLKAKTQEFVQKFTDGGLRRSELNAYLEAAQQASALIEHGLKSAADLVASFKQVAVDQASSKRRRFQVDKVCHDVIATMMAKIRQAGLTIQMDIPVHIEMDSYPGPFEQVIGNLVDNAILHAFEGRSSGQIWISARMCGEAALEVRFRDDGVGIPRDNLNRIFDPFFTTKLGQGGSGLGLNIVYNIVTGLLGGQIHIESEVQAGSSFIMQLPLLAPASEVD
ncbi:PAS-domain containing protein [Undibacterium sp. CY18W]|uniref:histidine kinase n=1 Tax=Undibacterium hunanense TaxID=2762292 RepID=A0ABR6ZLZ5_9BURK|nr:PAS-domain containing protein [Undibacterium hunanense]MBC3916909.1 PAS-domain containing protein [Undibacterium hunanense]